MIGLTSPGNRSFVERLGCYGQVVSYDSVASMTKQGGAVFVDMAGNAESRRALHTHLSDTLKYSCSVGGTHWDHLGSGRDLPGPKPVLFFAPAQIKKRNVEWGAALLQTRIAEAWRAFMRPVMDAQKGWMRVVAGSGPADVERVFRDMLDGRVRPDEGHVLSLP